MAHPGDPSLVEEVDDQLQFVEHFEVRHLLGISGLGEGLEGGTDHRIDTAAEDDLLAEEIGLGFVAEGRLDHAGAGTADAVCIGEGDGLRVAGCVLMDGDQRRDTASLDVLAPYEMTGALRGDHRDIHIRRGSDVAEADAEPVGEQQEITRVEVRGDHVFVKLRLNLVGHENHDDVGPVNSRCRVHDLEAGLGGAGRSRRTVPQADDDVDAGVLQIHRMGVTLTPESENRNPAAGDQRRVGVPFVVHRGHSGLLRRFSIESWRSSDLLRVRCGRTWRVRSHHMCSSVGGNRPADPVGP